MFGKQFREKLMKSLFKSSAIKHIGKFSLVQFNSYGSLNVRRFVQILHLYKKLYNENTMYGLIRNFSQRWSTFAQPVRFFSGLIPKKACAGALLSASLFSFTSHGIADEEMIEAANSLSDINDTASIVKSLSNNSFSLCYDESINWELVTEDENFNVWRRPVSKNSGRYEYKCAGRYFDVPASGFYIAQVDVEYRKKWDQLVICLDVVDTDPETGSEVVRWVTSFPFPMCPREYVYVRRSCVDPCNNTIVLTSKTVNHPRCPRYDDKFVRVDDYYSCMVIKPHSDDIYKNGFDYVLTYFDDPKASFPSFAYNWMVTSGVANFIQKVYDAAKSATRDKKQVEIARKNIYYLSTTRIPSNQQY